MRKSPWRGRPALATKSLAIAIILLVLVAAVAVYASSALGATSTPTACAGIGSPSFSSSPIMIGYLTELSGPNVPEGYAARIGAELAVNQTNAQGGVDGRQIQLVFADDQTNPTTAATEACVLGQQDQVLAITGPTDQGDALAVARFAEANGVPFVVSTVSSAALIPPHSNWTVSIEPDAVRWGAAVAKYVSEVTPGAKIALMTQNAEQQKEMEIGVRWYVSTSGNGSIVFDQLYANAQFPWATAAAAAKISGANAVVVPWISTPGFSESNVIEALISAGFQQSQIFVASATANLADLGDNASGINGAALFDGAMAQGSPNASAFVSELQPYVDGKLASTKYCGICPAEIGPVYYYSYLGMQMMMNAIQNVLANGQVLTRADFMSSMKHASITDAFGNTVSIDSSGSSLANFYMVTAGLFNITSGEYPLKIATTIQFSPDAVPAYELAKGA
jgi:branched-chain amino acid transport system substrate-binding protein